MQRHLWLLGTAATAAGVFVFAFVVVSALSGTSGAETVTVAAAPAVPREDTATDEIDAAEPVDGGRVANDLPPSPTLPSPPSQERAALPRFDEEALIYGGAGAEGAILVGHGIVRTTGTDRSTPWELLVPSARIRADIVRLGLTATRALGAPDNPHVIGWWEDGPAPGEPGNVLIDGHRDYEDIDGNVGTGVCWELPNTTVGDFLIVRDADEQLAFLYTVVEAASVPFDDPDAVRYLQPSRDSLLTLITCEGSFDSENKNYSNRRVIVAELTDAVPIQDSADPP